MTDTKPARMTPQRRVGRTAVQVLLAVFAAIPTAVATLPVSAELAAKIVGVAAAVVLLVNAAWNAYEAATGHTIGGSS